jgi:hypothetical protein
MGFYNLQRELSEEATLIFELGKQVLFFKNQQLFHGLKVKSINYLRSCRYVISLDFRVQSGRI